MIVNVCYSKTSPRGVWVTYKSGAYKFYSITRGVDMLPETVKRFLKDKSVSRSDNNYFISYDMPYTLDVDNAGKVYKKYSF